MKATYITINVLYRLSALATILAIVLGIIFVPMAVDPMPVLQVIGTTTIVGVVLSVLFGEITKRLKQSIMASMKTS